MLIYYYIIIASIFLVKTSKYYYTKNEFIEIKEKFKVKIIIKI
jgi:hypothetical protein